MAKQNRKVIPKPNPLKQHYSESWKTIKETKTCISTGIAIFIVFTLIGLIFPIFFVEELTKIIQQLILEFEGITTVETILKIFVNNALVSLLAIVFGLAIGLFPLWALIQNGYVVGFVANKVVAIKGMASLWKLLPHGVFELAAVFISIGLGLRVGCKVLRQDKPFLFLRDSLKVFFLVVLPLLVVAAIIEGVLIGVGV